METSQPHDNEYNTATIARSWIGEKRGENLRGRGGGEEGAADIMSKNNSVVTRTYQYMRRLLQEAYGYQYYMVIFNEINFGMLSY